MGQREITTEKRTRKELTEKDRYILELCLCVVNKFSFRVDGAKIRAGIFISEV